MTQEVYLAKRTRTAGPFEILVLPRLVAQDYRPKQDRAILVSIADPGVDQPQFKHEQTYSAVLRVQFADLDRTVPAIAAEPIYGTTAKRIAEFIRSFANESCELVIHCEAGVSRSAGVAAAVCAYCGNPEAEKHYLGEAVTPDPNVSGFIETDNPFYANRRVYRMVLDALRGEDK